MHNLLFNFFGDDNQCPKTEKKIEKYLLMHQIWKLLVMQKLIIDYNTKNLMKYQCWGAGVESESRACLEEIRAEAVKKNYSESEPLNLFRGSELLKTVPRSQEFLEEFGAGANKRSLGFF